MRILLDECIDERFRNFLPGHDCQTARYAGLTVAINRILAGRRLSQTFAACPLLYWHDFADSGQQPEHRALFSALLC